MSAIPITGATCKQAGWLIKSLLRNDAPFQMLAVTPNPQSPIDIHTRYSNCQYQHSPRRPGPAIWAVQESSYSSPEADTGYFQRPGILYLFEFICKVWPSNSQLPVQLATAHWRNPKAHPWSTKHYVKENRKIHPSLKDFETWSETKSQFIVRLS